MAAIHAASFSTPRPWTEREFRDLLSQPQVVCRTQEDGFVLGRSVADEAELLTIAVAPAARRRGIARKLLDSFLSEMDAQGIATTFLEVASDNIAACALYRSAGFSLGGERKNYYRRDDGSRVNALIFTRELSGKA